MLRYRLISRLTRSVTLFVRIQVQCSVGKSILAKSVFALLTTTVARRSFPGNFPYVTELSALWNSELVLEFAPKATSHTATGLKAAKPLSAKRKQKNCNSFLKTTLPGCLCQKRHPAQESKPRILTGAGNTKWYDSTINKILRNEKYMGDALLQKTVTTDFLTKKRVKNTKRLFLDKLEFT